MTEITTSGGLLVVDVSRYNRIVFTPHEDYKDMKNKNYTFFWRKQSPFSNWHACSFTVDGTQYNCMEQYMMAEKARLFDDINMLYHILADDRPEKHKEFGRKVQNYNDAVWVSKREEIVYKGLREKFTQNPSLKAILLATTGTLAEASPFDKVWGIGLSEDDSRAHYESQWLGLNLLGKLLTKLREELKNDRD